MIDKNNAEHYFWGSGCDGWRLVMSGELSVIQERMPPGSSETLHLHQKSRQFFFILCGSAVMEVAGLRETLHAGQGREIQPGTPHLILNESPEDLEFLVISQPPSRGDRIDL